MKILIAGGSGFVGTKLCADLVENNHQVTCLTRNKKIHTTPNVEYMTWDGKNLSTDKEFDIIINLCGESIADKRWFSWNKKRFFQSRIDPTAAICNYIKNSSNSHNMHLINASAIGIYPSSADSQDERTEIKINKRSFAQELVIKWEAAASAAREYGAKVTCIRLGVVLDLSGGMLKKLSTSFRYGLGCAIGNTKYKLSWVSRTDVSRAIQHIITLPNAKDNYIISSPQPCTKIEFAASFASLYGQKARLVMPEFATKILFGQMGEEILLSDQSIKPYNLIESGFVFRDNSISEYFTRIKGD